ncbi:alpha-2,8-polysialyltransferase family protein [Pseudomonas sp. GCM10022188]|uniref:alpha-2,8-polysialyltransferase family protein n=1 Tax=Pseudomonas TaxID=286 RepID=UPI001E44AD28|nr:alpha-2,8-polysialyltransferase family protein [Pseudomonas oryzagri]MCC6076899.1 alpha-2,8-polysialyltransferase family protein [Pseudomonas oryzagri]
MKLFIIGSPWHAAIANAIIKKENIEHPIIIAEQTTKQSIEQIKTTIKHQIKYTFNHEKTRFDSIHKHGVIQSIKRMDEEFSQIEISTNGLPSISKVFYFNFYSPITRKILYSVTKKNSGVALARVEDGICDYFNFNFINHNRLKLAAKNILAMALGKGHLYLRSNKELFQKTSEYYCFFPEKISKRWKTKKTIPLTDYANEITENFLISEKTSDATSLIIGQTLFEDGIASLTEEISIYSMATKTLPSPVVIKLHPRSSKEKVEAISKEGIKIIETSLSAESLICSGNYKTVVGMWSNTIIYSSCLFGVDSFTLTHQLLETTQRNNPHLAKIHKTLCTKFTTQYKDYRKAQVM